MLWNGYPIAARAWRVWRNEIRLNIDVLDTLAISASMLQGNPLAGSIVTWLIKLGDWIRDLTAAGAKRAVTELLEFQSKNAWVVRDDGIVSIPARELTVGDIVVVYPGEIIPVDGDILEGVATVDQKTITGESLPVSRGKGEAAFAATVLRDGQIAHPRHAGRRQHDGGADRASRRTRRRSATRACRTTPSASRTGSSRPPSPWPSAPRRSRGDFQCSSRS